MDDPTFGQLPKPEPEDPARLAECGYHEAGIYTCHCQGTVTVNAKGPWGPVTRNIMDKCERRQESDARRGRSDAAVLTRAHARDRDKGAKHDTIIIPPGSDLIHTEGQCPQCDVERGFAKSRADQAEVQGSRLQEIMDKPDAKMSPKEVAAEVAKATEGRAASRAEAFDRDIAEKADRVEAQTREWLEEEASLGRAKVSNKEAVQERELTERVAYDPLSDDPYANPVVATLKTIIPPGYEEDEPALAFFQCLDALREVSDVARERTIRSLASYFGVTI